MRTNPVLNFEKFSFSINTQINNKQTFKYDPETFRMVEQQLSSKRCPDYRSSDTGWLVGWGFN